MEHPDEVRLSPREKAVLQLVSEGHTRRRIALRLKIRPGTVDAHCHRAYEKLGAGNGIQAVTRARELGLLRRPDPDRQASG